MKIAVCIKQVPQTTNVKIDPETIPVRQGVNRKSIPLTCMRWKKRCA